MNPCKIKALNELCTCPERTDPDLAVVIRHWTENYVFDHFVLDYTSLEGTARSTLCEIGHCRICGKRLCIGTEVPPQQSTGGLFECAYRWEKQLWEKRSGVLPADEASFQAVFLRSFREEDRQAVLEWLKRQESCGECGPLPQGRS